MTALRELAERWLEKGHLCKREGSPVSGTQLIECADELLAILDAEGDGEAVARLVVRGYKAAGWELKRPLIDGGYDLYTHPARSGVVSDEDVDAALKVWNDAPALGRDEDDAYAMRAALEHFAKGERHEH